MGIDRARVMNWLDKFQDHWYTGDDRHWAEEATRLIESLEEELKEAKEAEDE